MKRTMMPVVMGLAAVGLAALALAQARTKPTEKILQSTLYATSRGVRAQDVGSRSATGITTSSEMRARGEALMAPGTRLSKEARTLLRQGKLEQAEQKCRQAQAFFRSTPAPYEADFLYEDLGDIQLAKGEYRKALESYAIARRYSADAELPLHTALCYIRLGDFKKAKQLCPDNRLVDAAYLDAARADYLPRTDNLQSLEATLLLVLGMREFMAQEAKTALSYLEPAGKLAPKSWFIAELTGRALDDLNRRDEAVLSYKLAVQLGGDKVSHQTQARAGVLKPTFLDGTPLPVVTPHPLAHETVKTQK